MNLSHREAGRGTVHQATARERDLEIELARLQAQLDEATGGDATAATSRFLALAATTVDMAVDQARREADELVTEVSAEAERRRDEAVRIAGEAEKTAIRFADTAEEAEAAANAARDIEADAQGRAEAARAAAQDVTAAAQHELDAARAEAKAITDDAHAEADEVRTSAEATASSLVTNERNRINEELEALTGVRTALEGERAALENYHEELRRRVQDLAESMVAFMTTEAPIGVSALDDHGLDELESATTAADPLEAAAQLEDAAELDDNAPLEEDHAPTSSGAAHAQTEGDEVFDRARTKESDADNEAEDETPFGDLVATTAEDTEDGSLGSLFSERGARLIKQSSSNDLANALNDDDAEADERFQDFLEGDDAHDPSREWLLRPENS